MQSYAISQNRQCCSFAGRHQLRFFRTGCLQQSMTGSSTKYLLRKDWVQYGGAQNFQRAQKSDATNTQRIQPVQDCTIHEGTQAAREAFSSAQPTPVISPPAAKPHRSRPASRALTQWFLRRVTFELRRNHIPVTGPVTVMSSGQCSACGVGEGAGAARACGTLPLRCMPARAAPAP